MMINFIHYDNFFICYALFFSVFLIALFIDRLVGEFPNKIHPVVLIGRIIGLFKNLFIDLNSHISSLILVGGVFLVFFIFCGIIYQILKFLPLIFVVFVMVILFSQAFSIKFLLDSAERVRFTLDNKDINTGRREVAKIVSRPTASLERPYLISATIESLSENITDSVIGPIFYYFVFGFIIIIVFSFSHLFDNSFLVTNLNLFIFNNIEIRPNIIVIDIIYLSVILVFIYRIINTMDAMVGYNTPKYKKIGFLPAIFDDLINLIPARIAGYLMVFASYILGMDWRNSYQTLKHDAKNCDSPNSGYTMAACAGALGIQLSKKSHYKIGYPFKRLESYDIRRAYNLSRWTIFLYILIQIFLTILILIIIRFIL